MSHRVLQLLTFFCCLMIAISACRLPTIELSPEEHDIVDTLYNTRIPIYRKELDSICKVTKDSLIKLKTDSLVKLQLIEIRKLVNRQ